MRLRRRLIALQLTAVSALLAGCTDGPDDSEAPGGSTPKVVATSGPNTKTPQRRGETEAAPGTTATGEAEPGVPYPAPVELTRSEPEVIASLKSSEGHSFDLVGVHRLADDRVVVTGLLHLRNYPNSELGVSQWEEAGYADYPVSHGFQFAPFELTTGSSDATYLPVRGQKGSCLCSVVRPGFQEREGPLAVMTVMSAPARAGQVNLAMEGYGEMKDVPVTEIPSTTHTSWGTSEVLAVRSARRTGGTISARLSMATTGDRGGSTSGQGAYNFGRDQNCFAGLVVTGPTKLAGLADPRGCEHRRTPREGKAEDVLVTFPDPGTDRIVFLPWDGFPMAADVAGEPAEGSGDLLVPFASRTRTDGATVTEGEQVTVDLDTSLFFEFGKARLTRDAKDSLAVAVEALRAQDGRHLTIVGHTDSQGDNDRNMVLSLRRAKAVRDALKPKLGPGWTFEVDGRGEEEPVAEEKGDPQQVEQAQARNRRVEITVTS